MSIKQAGMTLVEMIIAIVVIGVGLAGVITAFNMTVQNSGDPMVTKQMLVLAEEMMEEILLKPYGTSSGSITGCNRSLADDVSDYDGYDQVPCNLAGDPITLLSDYRIMVRVNASASLGAQTTDVKKVTVTVRKGTDHSRDIVLTGYRTNFGS